jgi:surface protein
LISGSVSFNPPAEGVTVKSLGSSDNVIDTRTTDSDGNFQIAVGNSYEIGMKDYSLSLSTGTSNSIDIGTMASDNGDSVADALLEGDGSSSNPYKIKTASDLQAIQEDLDAEYELVNDIDGSHTSNWNSGDGFKLVGTSSSPFTGVFSCNGNNVDSLTVNAGTFGIFGVTSGATTASCFTNTQSQPFVMTVDSSQGSTSNDKFEVKTAGNNDYTVGGDVSGSPVDCSSQSSCTVNVANSGGENTLKIYASSLHIKYSNLGEEDGLLSIDEWGKIQWTSFKQTFYGADNLQYNASDDPDMSQVTSMRRMFRDSSSFNGNISSWDTSSVTNMRETFKNAEEFNQDLNSWDTSSVTGMDRMFDTSAFNQDISSWCVSQISYKPFYFDNNAGFAGDTSKQPNWGDSCS